MPKSESIASLSLCPLVSEPRSLLEGRFYREWAIQPTKPLVWALGIHQQNRPPFRNYYDTATMIFCMITELPPSSLTGSP